MGAEGLKQKCVIVVNVEKEMNAKDKAYWSDKSLAEARQYLRDNWKKGCECLACGQRVQLYNRPLTSSMVYGLWLVRNTVNVGDGYFHAENLFKNFTCPSSVRGDFPKLRFWGFIEQKVPNTSEVSTSNGLYKITDKGLEFLKGNMLVPASVLIYNNKFIGFGTKEIDFKGALNKKFNINELTV